MIISIFYFLAPFFVGIIAIFLLLKFSEKTNFLVDVPEGDVLKIHKKSIPLIGGLGMALAILLGFLFITTKEIVPQLIAIILLFLIIFCVMLWDDLKWKHISTIKPFLKFPILLLSALIPAIILSFSGIIFNFVPLYIVAILLGFIYIFTVINSINYQDSMDGLAGCQVFISLLGFVMLSLITGNSFVLLVALVCLGAVASFLCFNFPPAKVFMGDSGAYSLGFLLSVFAMLFSRPYEIYSVLGPIFIIGLPIFDGVFTNIRRIANGKSIFLGDRSHFYDKLLQKGFSTKKTLAICYGIQVLLVIVGIAIYSYT